jgi:hypothetical protein
MRLTRWHLFAFALIALPSIAAAGSPLAIGSKAPMRETTMKCVGGTDTSIGAAAGKKGTLVIFMCNHCPWVKAWQTRIAAIGNAALDQGIGVIAINPNDPAAYPEDDFDQMVTRAKQLGFKFCYAVDATSEIAMSFGATHTPEAFLFDAGGKLVYHGAVDDNAKDESAVKHPWLQQAVSAVTKGKPVSDAETKAMGCSIKFRAPRSS